MGDEWLNKWKQVAEYKEVCGVVGRWVVKGTVQRVLRWVKIGINRTARINCIAGKCNFPCPNGHHHESIINVLGGCSTF